MNEEAYNKLTRSVISAAIEVHKQLGPGLLEAVYEECLISELKERGHKVKSQLKLPIIYKGKELSKHFIIDIIVDDKLIIELMAVENILAVHEVQLVSYLKLSGMKLGLLINFNETVLKNGIRRRINS